MVDQETQGHNLYTHLEASEPHPDVYVRQDLIDDPGDLLVTGEDGIPVALPITPYNTSVLTADSLVPGRVVWRLPDAVKASLVLAKGDLLVAYGPGLVARLPVGLNGQALLADSSEFLGVRWGDVAVATCPWGLDFSYECDSGYVAVI